jgi:hypothetical protein
MQKSSLGLAIALSPASPLILIRVILRSYPFVQFDQRLILELNGPLAILSLGPHASIPHNLLQQFILSAGPNTTLRTNSSTGDQFAYDGDNLIAFVTVIRPAVCFRISVCLNLGATPIFAFQYISDSDQDMFAIDHVNISLIKGRRSAGSITFPGRDPSVFVSYTVVQRNIIIDG